MSSEELELALRAGFTRVAISVWVQPTDAVPGSFQPWWTVADATLTARAFFCRAPFGRQQTGQFEAVEITHTPEGLELRTIRWLWRRERVPPHLRQRCNIRATEALRLRLTAPQPSTKG